MALFGLGIQSSTKIFGVSRLNLYERFFIFYAPRDKDGLCKEAILIRWSGH